MGDTNVAPADRGKFTTTCPKDITFVDDIVRSDGPIFSAMRKLYGNFDCKDLADVAMKLPVAAVLRRFAETPRDAGKAELEGLFKDCFYTGFPDVCEWKPPDIPESPLSWLILDEHGMCQAPVRPAAHEGLGGCSLTSMSWDNLTANIACAEDATEPSALIGSSEAMQNSLVHDLYICAENEFARGLVNAWASLGRKAQRNFSSDSRGKGENFCYEIVSSLLDVPFGFIVPGGRFREMYYWDSYWTVRGLLYSGMVSTARGMILNFAYLVRRFGFVPNGTRSYYLTRSQPPVFSMMLSAYYEFTGDLGLLVDTYLDVEREYLYWVEDISRRVCVAVDGKSLLLNRYLGHIAAPRTESWQKDMKLVSGAADIAHSGISRDVEAARAHIFRNIRAAAESGWDFSSRWVPDYVDATKENVMPNLSTESFLPVDLNSFLYHSELYLFHFGRILRESGTDVTLIRKPRPPEFFHQQATERREAMLKLLWNEDASWWFDFDVEKGQQSTRVTAAGVAPFLMQIHSSVSQRASCLFGCGFTGGKASGATSQCSDSTEVERAQEAAAYEKQLSMAWFLVEKSGLWETWGLSTTQIETGQQWDGSNCWPPLIQMALEAMVNLGECVAKEALKSMANRHISSCMQTIPLNIEDGVISWHELPVAYKRLGALPEKSSSVSPGSCGGGGSYKCQQGFGWSIGVALEFLFYKRRGFCSDKIRLLRREFGSAAFRRAANESCPTGKKVSSIEM